MRICQEGRLILPNSLFVNGLSGLQHLQHFVEQVRPGRLEGEKRDISVGVHQDERPDEYDSQKLRMHMDTWDFR